jgi:hypothetical protein
VGSGVADEETLIMGPSGITGLSVVGEGVGISGFLGDSAIESGLSVAGEEVGSLGEA